MEMALTVEEIYSHALLLPDDSKESLAERLVAYLETHVDPEVERTHIAEAKQRRDEIRSGQILPVDGESVMAKARQIVTQ